ncbi:MAG: ABC transporter substrate-binding protein [Hyphomicrobiales bacterium]|nr:ABC transporter substrate-binding protein [Hyphomicrobiales bacterium]
MTAHRGPTRRSLLAAPALLLARSARARPLSPEKDVVRLGVAKRLDLAPLALAADLRFFEENDLQVILEPQASWKTAFDRLLTGDLDAAQLYPAQLLAAAAGIGPAAALVTPATFGPDRTAVVLPRADAALFAGDAPEATPLRAIVDRAAASGKRPSLGVAAIASTEALAVRAWLAAAGIHPGWGGRASSAADVDAEIAISVVPPPQMPATLEEGALAGFVAAEPWPRIAEARGLGRAVIAGSAIVDCVPGSVLAFSAAWAEAHPQTVEALVEGLLRAARWLDADDGRNHAEAAHLLSASDRLGADEAIIAASLAAARSAGGFFSDFATHPFRDDAVWTLAEMRRWGLIEETRDDAWYDRIAASVLRPEIHRAVAGRLIEAGRARPEEFPGRDDVRRATPLRLFASPAGFDPRRPNAHLAACAIGRDGPGTP